MDAVRVIGREAERAWLEEAAAEAIAGHGSLVLLGGDAGVGKTRLVEAVATTADATFLRGAASPAAPPYCPIVAALRHHLRRVPDALEDCGRLRGHLALLLPELGDAVAGSDRATLLESVRCGLATIAGRHPAIILLDDLQWSDDATLELLAALAATLRDLPVLLIAAYRTDEVPRSHPLRGLRTALRRDRMLRELVLEPLTPEHTAELTAAVLDVPVSPALARIVQHRTQGVPFFVEELVTALRGDDRLQSGPAGTELAGESDVPLPGTIRDAVLLRTAGLARRARATAEAAAVAGPRFEMELVAALGGGEGLEELAASGVIVEAGGGVPRSATRLRATRSTRTFRGCVAGRCIAALPSASQAVPAGAPRSPRTGSPRASRRARSTRSCAPPGS